jgi:peptidyl-prolyl cis-trans isomerase C
MTKGWMVVVAILTAGGTALGQAPNVRTVPSPVEQGDNSRPRFRTAQPVYEGVALGTQAGDTVVAEVDGRAITLAQVGDRVKGLPQGAANLPFDVLFPAMVEQLVRREAMVLRGQRQGYDDDPVVRRRMREAADEVLANETLARDIADTITDARLHERYRRDYEGKPGPEQARVRVIFTHDEAGAADAIAKLKAGQDFGTLAKAVSKDSSAPIGGDLGFLARDGLNPELGAVAFVLAPGQTSAYPVRSAAGWFVIRVEERRMAPTPPFSALREVIRQTLVREAAPGAIRGALSHVTIREYDMPGKEREERR